MESVRSLIQSSFRVPERLQMLLMNGVLEEDSLQERRGLTRWETVRVFGSSQGLLTVWQTRSAFLAWRESLSALVLPSLEDDQVFAAAFEVFEEVGAHFYRVGLASGQALTHVPKVVYPWIGAAMGGQTDQPWVQAFSITAEDSLVKLWINGTYQTTLWQFSAQDPPPEAFAQWEALLHMLCRDHGLAPNRVQRLDELLWDAWLDLAGFVFGEAVRDGLAIGAGGQEFDGQLRQLGEEVRA